jgi:hypothetical protein
LTRGSVERALGGADAPRGPLAAAGIPPDLEPLHGIATT